MNINFSLVTILPTVPGVLIFKAENGGFMTRTPSIKKPKLDTEDTPSPEDGDDQTDAPTLKHVLPFVVPEPEVTIPCT